MWRMQLKLTELILLVYEYIPLEVDVELIRSNQLQLGDKFTWYISSPHIFV